MTTDSAEPDSVISNTRKSRLQKIARMVVVLAAVFGIGYRLGGGNVELMRASLELSRHRVRRFPFLAALAVYLLLKDGWEAIPSWAKTSLTPFKSRRERSLVTDSDDMTDVKVIASKLKGLFDHAQDKLGGDDEEKVDIFGPFLAGMQLLDQLRDRRANARAERIQRSGRLGTRKDAEGLRENFEFADWAYDESPLGSLEENLEREGFSLLKHDKTSLPGYVGHYVAISKKKKLAIIGVRGTSNFEDLLTDCCGEAVMHRLDAPFSTELSGNEIRCHEGILISSKRLADDLQPFVEKLLLPTGYEMLLVGHSLGAAGAAMLALLLRSRIPALAADTYGRKLRVVGYACPPILDYKSARACEKFTTTVVNNSDVIPRASLSNLAVSLEILKEVNKRLAEKGMDTTTWKSKLSLLDQISKGTEGELIMEEKDLVKAVAKATEKVDPDDPSNLFVPGKVIVMYDDMKKKQVNDKDEESDKAADGFVISEDGATEVMRTIEWNNRMVSDHMAPSIRSNLESVVKNMD